MAPIKLLPIKLAEPDTPAWHARRKYGIGASEAARACGFSDYGMKLDLYYLKTGELKPFEGNRRTRMGKKLESAIESEFEYESGIKVIDSPMGLYRSSENSFILATPDADLETGDLAEWKTMNSRMAAANLGEETTENIPTEWIFQCQQQMYVMQRERVYVVVLTDFVIRTYQVHRNDKLIDGIIEAERELWERIENRDPPEPVEHPRTIQLARELYGVVENMNTKNLSDAAAEAWERKRQAGRLIRKLKAREDFEKAKVLLEIGDHYAGILPGGEKMIRRKKIIAEVEAHTKDYVDVREVKVPKLLLKG